MTDLIAKPNALARPGSFKRAWWLYLSSTAAMWVLWAIAGLAVALGQDHSNDEYWGLAVYVAVVIGTVLVFLLNAIVWFSVGWLIDAKANPTWPWYLAIGVVLGTYITFALWAPDRYSLIAGHVIAIGGFVIGPLVARWAFGSHAWRVAVTVTIIAALASIVVVLL